MFLSFYARLSFIDSALDTVKQHLREKFPGRAKTLLIQIKDHARGIASTDKRFPSAIWEMMKSASSIESLSLKERKDCYVGLSEYLQQVLGTEGLDENLRKALKIFQGRLKKQQDITDN